MKEWNTWSNRRVFRSLYRNYLSLFRHKRRPPSSNYIRSTGFLDKLCDVIPVGSSSGDRRRSSVVFGQNKSPAFASCDADSTISAVHAASDVYRFLWFFWPIIILYAFLFVVENTGPSTKALCGDYWRVFRRPAMGAAWWDFRHADSSDCEKCCKPSCPRVGKRKMISGGDDFLPPGGSCVISIFVQIPQNRLGCCAFIVRRYTLIFSRIEHLFLPA